MNLFRSLVLIPWLLLSGATIRVLILGKTGAGKSASANTLLNVTSFLTGASLTSVTESCKTETGRPGGVELALTDTPGLFDTNMPPPVLKEELERCMVQSAPGPHAILLAVNLKSRFTAEEAAAVDWIVKNLGEEALRHTIVTLTHADFVPRGDVAGYLKKSIRLTKIINDCGGRWVALVNGPGEALPGQRMTLLSAVIALVEFNGGRFYTNSEYGRVQAAIGQAEKDREETRRVALAKEASDLRDEIKLAEWKRIKLFLVVALGVMGAYHGSATLISIAVTAAAIGGVFSE